MVGINFV